MVSGEIELCNNCKLAADTEGHQIYIETFASEYPSEHHTAGIRVYYEEKNKNFKEQFKKWNAGQKSSMSAWNKYEKEKDVYEKELIKYNEWRDNKIKQLEDEE